MQEYNFKALADQLRSDDPTAILPPVSMPPIKTQTDVLGSALHTASVADPARALKNRALAKTLGQPTEILPPDAEQQAFLKQNSAQEILDQHPAVARYLAKKGNADLVGKDVPPLRDMEATYRTLGTAKQIGKNLLGSFAAAPQVAEASLASIAQGGADVLSKATTPLSQATGLPDVGQALSQLFGDHRASRLRVAERLRPDLSQAGPVERGVYSGVESAGLTLMALPLSIASGSPAPLLAALSTVTGGTSFGLAREKGLDLAAAARYGATDAAIEYLTEKLPVGNLLKNLSAGTGLGKTIKDFLVREVPGEQLATILQDMNEWVTLNPTKTFKEYLIERPEAAITTLVATLVGGSIQVSAAKGLAAGFDKLNMRAVNARDKAEQAVKDHSTLTAMGKQAAEHPLNSRSPEAFKEFIDTMAEDGNVSDVYINPAKLEETLSQSGLSQAEIAQTMPEMSHELGIARTTGSDVRIPLSEYVAHIAGTPMEAGLIAYLRTDPKGATYEEAQQFYQTQQKELATAAQKILLENTAVLTPEEFAMLPPEEKPATYDQYLAEHTNKAEVYRQDVQKVHDTLTAEMSKAGRFTPEVNAAYAVPLQAFYTVNAARLGIMPSELYARYPLTFQAMMGGEGMFQPRYQGHTLESGGLQGHSLGEMYPFVVTGVGVNGGFQLMNASTGQYGPRRTTYNEALADMPIPRATPEDFKPGDVKNILNRKNWVILTATNPNATEQTPEQNAVAQNKLKLELDAQGLKYESVYGMYAGDQSEVESLIVYGVKPDMALGLGRKYGQDSVLTSQGLVYRDGSFRPAAGVKEYATVEEALQDEEGGKGYTRAPSTGAIFSATGFNWSAKNYVAVHFSKEKRTALKGVFAGTGIPAAERKRLELSDDARIKQRIDFYTDTGKGVKPEAGLGGARHDVVLKNIYDAAENVNEYDPGQGAEGLNAFEIKILDEGFDGYFIEQGNQGRVVVMGRAAESILAPEVNLLAQAPFQGPEVAKTPIGRKKTINVDGVKRSAQNSNGQPIHWSEEGIRNFWRWFGDSKVVDEQGRPRVVYHGSRVPYIDSFGLEMEGTGVVNTGNKPLGGVWFTSSRQNAAFFADQRDDVKADVGGVFTYGGGSAYYAAVSGVDGERLFEVGPHKTNEAATAAGAAAARRYNTDPTRGEAIIAAYLALQNPLALDGVIPRADAFGRAKSQGDDGIVAHAVTDGATVSDVYVAFDPAQIKSSTGNMGAFSPTDPSILAQSAFYSALQKEIGGLQKIANKQGEVKIAQAKAWIDARQKEGKFKKEEVEALGLMDWLDVQKDKISVADVENFVRENGVRVEDVLLSLTGGEVEFYKADAEIKDPDPTQIEEQAKSIYLEDIKNEMAAEEDIPLAEVDETEAMERAKDEAWRDYYDDPDAPQTADAFIDFNGRTWNYTFSYAYGEVQIYSLDRGDYLSGYNQNLSDQQILENDVAQQLGLDSLEEQGVQYADWQLPGGHDYKELLLTLPDNQQRNDFSAGHYATENVLAHVRFNKRTNDAGEHTLFIEEIQSDWAQKGREEGFATFYNPKEIILLDENSPEASAPASFWYFRVPDNIFQIPKNKYPKEEDARRHVQRKPRGKIPQAPFVQDTKSWVALVIKRMLRYAAEGGFDRIAWTTGAQQVNRWVGGLRKAVDVIDWTKTPEGVHLVGYKSQGAGYVRGDPDNGFYAHAPGGRVLGGPFPTHAQAEVLVDSSMARSSEVVNTVEKENALSDAIGKAMADTIKNDPNQSGTIEGKNITISDTGMAGFYDKIVPQVANDILKKLSGGKVERIPLNTPEATVEKLYILKWTISRDVTDIVVLDADSEDMVMKQAPLTSELPELVGKELADYMAQAGRFRLYPREIKGSLGKELTRLRAATRTEEQPTIVLTPELRAKIMQGLPLFQSERAGYNPTNFTISLLKGADLSSTVHEGAHFYLQALADMASRPDAPAQIKKDFQTTLAWFNLTTKQDWRTMTLDQQRPYHEQWAQSFERYALEGKAPTMEMQPVFARFRAWMLNVYKSMQEFLRQNPLAGKLNDDVRAVFDRLLAAEEDIKSAEAARGYAPLFSTAEEAKITQAQFDDYIADGALATEQAMDDLSSRSIRDMRWLSNAKSATIKALQAEANAKRKVIKDRVTEEVMAEPINQARVFLRSGKVTASDGTETQALEGFKLNTEEARALEPDLSALQGMTSQDGLSPGLAAQMFGFSSGDELIQALIHDEKAKDKIDAITDQRMLEQHGELSSPQDIERAAEKAIHNEARARFMATGLKLLLKSPISVPQLNKAAKQAAESTIAEKRVRDLRPAQYERAETKAGKEAIKKAPTDTAGAIKAQREALMNNRLAKASQEAVREVEKVLRYVGKFQTEGTRKALDIDYIEQIDDLLQSFDFRKGQSLAAIDKRKSLADWIDEQEATGFEPAIDASLMDSLKRKSYQDMTLTELRGLITTVKQIEHLGRLKKKLLTAKDAREFAEIVLEANESIRMNANRTVKERGTPADVVGMTGKWLRQMTAQHRKFASLIREMDGSQDGGAMWRLLARPMNEAGDSETEAKTNATEAIAALFKLVPTAVAPGNIYARKKLVPGTNLSMTHEQRIMFAMNWGNEGNRQRLLDGGITGQRALSIVEADRVLDTLTKNEWDFVQGIWDFIGGYKEQIAELERDLTGVEPTWIPASPVITKYGTYPGGYFPAKYDTDLSTRSESLEAVTNMRLGMQGAFNSAATRNGYTKARSAEVVNRPLLLSYNAISQHVSEVTHRLAWQRWIVDANRLLKALDSPIRTHYGPEILREMRDTVSDIAAGDAPAKNATEAAINRLRVGSTIVGMGWRVSTALLQPSGLAQSWVRVGGPWIAKGVARYLANPLSSSEFVNSKSKLMSARGRTMQREINEVLNTIRAGDKVSTLTASYFTMIGKMQRIVDIPTWYGAYEKALEQLHYEAATDEDERKKIEDTAVALADQAVIDSQSGGQLKDLANVQRGSPMFKIFTNFYSYFSATYNLNVEAVRRTSFKSPTQVGLLAVDLIILNSIPVLFSVALKELLKGECQEDMECLANKLGHEQLSFLFGQMVLLREVGTAIDVAAGGQGYGYQGPAGLRFFGDLYKVGQQVNQGDADMALFKAANQVGGAVFHYPAGQINTTLEGIMAVEDGRVDGVSILPALIAGPPKH